MASSGLRQRKKDALRRALHDEALRLFGEQGFDDTTVVQICDRVGVSERTFFRYFDAKEDVLLGDLGDVLQAAAAAVANQPADRSPLEAVLAALVEVRSDERPTPLPLALAALRGALPRGVSERMAVLLLEWELQVADALLVRAALDPAAPPPDARLRCRVAAGAAGVALRSAFEQLRASDRPLRRGVFLSHLTESIALLGAGCPPPDGSARQR